MEVCELEPKWKEHLDALVAFCTKCERRGGKLFLCSYHEGMDDGFYWLAAHAPKSFVPREPVVIHGPLPTPLPEFEGIDYPIGGKPKEKRK